ncbi:hypothetical protein ACH4VY_39175 [Streptomyces griseus]|uniref:hypothetical protein n=1 Tax=Streptomyces griseus TaxID=1911 RepID=UPI0037A273C0
MTCFKPGERSRLIYAIREYRGRKDEPKYFDWRDCRDPIARARIPLCGPIAVRWVFQAPCGITVCPLPGGRGPVSGGRSRRR